MSFWDDFEGIVEKIGNFVQESRIRSHTSFFMKARKVRKRLTHQIFIKNVHQFNKNFNFVIQYTIKDNKKVSRQIID